MIGSLRGLLIQQKMPVLTLDVQGVGYEVSVPLSILESMPPLNTELFLWIHTSVREDAIQLFGFLSAEERQLFRLLVRISGVGPKMALAILSGISGHDLARAVASKDANALTRVPGVGKKTAERLVIELTGKLAPVPGSDLFSPAEVLASDASMDAISALESLGYPSAQAAKAVKAVQAAGMTAEQLIRLALRGLA